MAQLALALLGGFQARLDGGPALGFDTAKTRALLAYLADKPGKLHPRSALAGLFWPDYPESSALNNLRSSLSVLRHAIRDVEASPPCLLAGREAIAFNPEAGVEVDTLRFSGLLGKPGSADLDDLARAAALYRGDFLAGFATIDSAEFEAWILMRREHYRSAALEALYTLTEEDIARGDFAQARAWARRQLEIEPWREEAHQQLMSALACEGRRSEALAQYAACRAVLERELGAGPGLTTTRLYERIRDGRLPPPAGRQSAASPPATEAPSNESHAHPALPQPLTTLVGRESEIQAAHEQLAGCRLLTLSGAGGVGKSRLALALAAADCGEYPDGAALAELAAIERAEDVPGAVAACLGLGKGPVQPNAASLSAALGSRQLLLVLDNCEHLLAACAGLARALLPACPGVKILATSREPLGAPGERVYRVPSLSAPPLDPLPCWHSALEYSAVCLFAERARAVQPAFRLDEKTWPVVAAICQRLDGIPLALELAAGRLDLLSPAQLAARLEGSFRLLSGAKTGLARHQTLRATLDWSYTLLTPNEQKLLARLAVFSGGWLLEAAESVCGEGLNHEEVFDLLAGLVNKSLVAARRQESGETRFFLLETVRQYALEKLVQSGEEQALRARHCAHFLAFSWESWIYQRNERRLEWNARLDAESENIFRAIGWAIDEGHDVPRGLEIVCALNRWWAFHGHVIARGLGWLRSGLAQWSDPAPDQLATYIHALTICAHGETSFEAAQPMIQRAMALYEQLEPGQRKHDCPYLSAAVIYFNWLNDLETAETFVDRGLQITRNERPPHWQWNAGALLEYKGWIAYRRGQYDQATDNALESCWFMRQSGDHWACGGHDVLGAIALRHGNYSEAQRQWKEMLNLQRVVDDCYCIHTFQNLARVERMQDRYAQAMTILREGLRVSREQYSYFESIEVLHEMAFTEIEHSRSSASRQAIVHLRHAARLLGAAEALQATDWLRILVVTKPIYPAMLKELQDRLDSRSFQNAWDEGMGLSVEQAIRYALEYAIDE